jgi:peptidyl-prolyl cis-trans isomerase C
MQAKTGTIFWALVTAVTLALVACLSAIGESEPSQDKVAVVNGSVITRADFDREMTSALGRLSSPEEPVAHFQLSQLKEEVFKRLIARELLYQESQNNGIKVNEVAINEQLVMLKKRFPGEAEFKKMLSRMNLSEVDVKSQFERAMAIQEFIEKQFVQKVTVSDKEVRAYYDSNPVFFKQAEQVRASHILVSVDPQKDPLQKAESRKKIEDIQQKLRKGEDFSELAKEYSQCPSGSEGGDLGYFQRGQMVKPFEQTAFALRPGEVSDIVETKFGYHLIRLADKKPESVVPYEDIKDRIGQYLKQEKAEKDVVSYVKNLEEKAKVEKFATFATED